MNRIKNHSNEKTHLLWELLKKSKKADGLYHLKKINRMQSDDINAIHMMMDRLNENEIIQRRFYELESKILSILNFQDFFEILLTEMGTIFKVPYVWLSVIKKSSLANLINPLIDSKIIIEKTKFINASDFKDVLGHISTPMLFNGDLAPFAVFLPKGKRYLTGSMALAPVEIDGEIVGSLNQWDSSPSRFEPDMDTSSLEQLMIKISLCLSNVAAHEKLKHFAYHDPLTGLLNRRAFENVLAQEYSRAKRHSHDLSLIFLDLDKFKQINDQHGHDAGDDALVYIADTLQSSIREEDIVARYAGDEFVIILPETSSEKSERLMQRIQLFLSHNPLTTQNGEKIGLSLSYGITSSNEKGVANAAGLLKKSDEKLYNEKERKKYAPKPA